MTYPRVTEVLRPFTSYEYVPTDILARAAARGTAVHALCAGIAKGAWIPDSMIAEEYVGYVTSFRKWAEAQVKDFIIVERRFTNEGAGYTGQVDLVVLGGKTDGVLVEIQGSAELYLVDLKTSAKPQKTYPVQMSAYERLLLSQGIKVKGCMIVYLDKNGDFPDIDYLEDLNKEYSVFISALECWNYFNRRKKDGRKNTAENTGRERIEASAEKPIPEDSGGDV